MKKLFSHILLVDDDIVTNYINECLLEDMQVADRIHVVQDGMQALAFIERHWLAEVDLPLNERGKLLLLDLNLNDLDGFEFLERLEKLPPIQHLCIIILSTSRHTRDTEKAKKFKVEAFIEKPLTKNKLEALSDKLKQCVES